MRALFFESERLTGRLPDTYGTSRVKVVEDDYGTVGSFQVKNPTDGA